MATENFFKGTDGDYNVAANWTAGVVPTGGHIAVLDGRKSQYHLDVNIGLGLEGPTAFVVRENYYGSIGGPGNYLTNLAANTTKVVIRGRGSYYLSPPVYAGFTVIDTPEGVTHLTSASLPPLFVKRGRCVVDVDAVFGSGSIVQAVTLSETAHLTIEASSNASNLDLLRCEGGTFIMRSSTHAADQTRINVTGGLFRMEGILDANTYTHIGPGGIMEYAPVTDPAADAIRIYVGGTLDVHDSEWEIPCNQLIIGPRGVVEGSALELLRPGATLDLSQDYP